MADKGANKTRLSELKAELAEARAEYRRLYAEFQQENRTGPPVDLARMASLERRVTNLARQVEAQGGPRRPRHAETGELMTPGEAEGNRAIGLVLGLPLAFGLIVVLVVFAGSC